MSSQKFKLNNLLMEIKKYYVLVLLAFIAWFACMPPKKQKAITKFVVAITALLAAINALK